MNLCTLMFFVMVAATAGCGPGGSPTAPFEVKVELLQQEKARLTSELERCKIENEQLSKQVANLSHLPPDRSQNPYALASVKVSDYTNLYDENGDGKREKLIVYVVPIDQDGDTVKAAGTVDVELWDLSRPDGQAFLGKWHFEPNELRKLWLSAWMRTNYRLVFDAPAGLGQYKEPLTVKVVFTEYLTGKVFEEQRMIEP